MRKFIINAYHGEGALTKLFELSKLSDVSEVSTYPWPGPQTLTCEEREADIFRELIEGEGLKIEREDMIAPISFGEEGYGLREPCKVDHQAMSIDAPCARICHECGVPLR